MKLKSFGPPRLVQRILILLLLLPLCACGGRDGSVFDIGPGGSNPDLADVSVFDPAGPHAAVLKNCAIAGAVANLCTLETLPLIGQEFPAPTVAEVTDRVLASHPWMAQRFVEVLGQLPPDILTLFKGVTAIVIDADVRPSFYSPDTAAIYLDPATLWLTNEEKATISKTPDFRSDFGAELQFVSLWRYVKDNDYAYLSFPLDGTETRQLADIILPLARLLYHELAHANDFLPPALQPTLDRRLTPRAASQSLAGGQVVDQLVATAPLTSRLWAGLARVLFLGDQATAEQKSASAGFVGVDFERDVASDTYAYSSSREDVAMLFEETMMKVHFGVDRDLAFTDLPVTATPVCNDFLVQWGVRNRIGEGSVGSRAQLVAAGVLPASDLSGFFAGLAAPAPMAVNLGWCSNLNLGAAATLGLEPSRAVSAEQLRQDRLPPGISR